MVAAISFEKKSWGLYKEQLLMLLKLSWPNILTSLVQLALPVTSTLAVGHLGDPAFIGAAALGNMFANATGNALGSGLSMALDTLCSQAYGAKKYKLVGLHCQRAMVILSIVCIPIAILWWNAWVLLQFISTDDAESSAQILNLSQFWIRRLLPSLWPRIMYETYRRYLLSQRIMWPLTVSVGCTVPFHILNTYLFVYHFNFGFQGAVWATSISYWILFLTLLCISHLRLVVLRRREALKESGGHMKIKNVNVNDDEEEEEEEEEEMSTLGSSVGSSVGLMEREEGEEREETETKGNEGTMVLSGETEETEFDYDNGDPLHTWPNWSKDVFRGWISFLKLGVATALSLVIEWGSFEVNAAIAARLGEVPLAAHAIMCNSVSIWYSFPLGVATASTALVGNMLGAGEPKRAQIIARLGFGIAFVYGIVNGAMGLLYRDFLGKAFTEDQEVVKLISSVMYVMWLYGIVDAMKAVGMAVLRGSGRPKVTVYGNILACLMVGYPVALLLVLKGHFGLNGLWFGMSTAWLTASITYGIIIGRTNWEQEVLNAAKRNTEAEQSTKRGQNLAKQGLLMSVVVKSSSSIGKEVVVSDDEEGSFSINGEDSLLSSGSDKDAE